jgi:hypothetical protein
VLSRRQRLGNAKLLSIRPPDDEFIEQSKNYLNIWSNLFLSTEFEFFMMYQRKKSVGTGREQVI